MSNLITPKTSEVIARLKSGDKIPARALRCNAEPPVAKLEADSADKTIKVTMKARSRDPINHWFFGSVVHDFSTAKLPAKIALDDSHGNEIGYARPTMTDYGLELSGVVIPNEENEQHESNRIAYNLRNSIPQQASIDFCGDYDLAEILDGKTAIVNGKPVTGPALVVQNWSLRASAICKEGADPSTETVAQFAADDEVAPAPKSITQFGMQDSGTPTEKQESVSETISNLSAEVPATVVEAKAETKTEMTAVENPLAVEGNASAKPVEAMTVVNEPQPSQPTATETKLSDALAQIEVLTARVNALSKPSIPAIAGMASVTANAPVNWAQAIDEISKTHPNLSATQKLQLADKQFPGLRAQFRATAKSPRQHIAAKAKRHGSSTTGSNSAS